MEGDILIARSQSLILLAGAGQLANVDSNENDAASSSQVWQSDVKPNVGATRWLLLQDQIKIWIL